MKKILCFILSAVLVFNNALFVYADTSGTIPTPVPTLMPIPSSKIIEILAKIMHPEFGVLEDFFKKDEVKEELAKGGADSIETFCQIYCEEAEAENIRAEVAFTQAMKETGFLQVGGDVSIEQFNFAGIGTTGGGVPGNSYPDVRTGVRAQIQHLKAYATDEPLNQTCVDNRYEYVKKASAPYVQWLGQKENPEGAGWATGENYGYDIAGMLQHLLLKEQG